MQEQKGGNHNDQSIDENGSGLDDDSQECYNFVKQKSRPEEPRLLENVTVLERVLARHPEIEEEDVKTAWRNAIALNRRNYDPPEYYAAAGLDRKNRMLEMVGVATEDDGIAIYHAMKLSDEMRAELGLG